MTLNGVQCRDFRRRVYFYLLTYLRRLQNARSKTRNNPENNLRRHNSKPPVNYSLARTAIFNILFRKANY